MHRFSGRKRGRIFESTTRISTTIFLLSVIVSYCEGWISPQVRASQPPSNSRLFDGIQTVDVGSMNDDHEKEGQRMADSIVAWLDAEWIPQQVHIDMAESAKQSYIKCREANQSDVMDIMMQISTDLDANWAKYNADAFVNAWDIGNYCSDYLVQRSGNESCECSSQIF